VTGAAIKRIFEIALSSLEIGGPLASHSPVPPTGGMATPDRFGAADRRWRSLAAGLIVATDTAFSSNRFAWTHQAHKLDLQVEPKDDVMNRLRSTDLLKCSRPLGARCAPVLRT
jgi:hypothetical protein